MPIPTIPSWFHSDFHHEMLNSPSRNIKLCAIVVQGSKSAEKNP